MSKNNKKETKQFKTINADLSMLFLVDYMAFQEMQKLQGAVSDKLFNVLLKALPGFEAEMQFAIAFCLEDFVKNKVLHKTNCLAADTILMTCYFFIAKERGMDISEVVNNWFSMVDPNDYPVL